MSPKIKIKYNRFLDPIFIFYCQNNPDLIKRGWDKWIPPTKEVLDKRIENYKTVWEEVETKVLPAMCSVLGLEFKRNVIDVHVVSGNPRQLSSPLIIKSGYSPRDFVSTLMHELIHILCSDNEDILPKLESIYPGENLSTKNHVITHAVLKYLYLDVINDPKMLEENLVVSKAHSTSDYSRAWEIVDSIGYLKVIEDFKGKYNKTVPRG